MILVKKSFPIPNDRMGTLWALTSIQNAVVIEFGPAGTTHFAIEGVMELNAEHKMQVFTTHISEMDITFGQYDKLVGAVKEVDREHNPDYIFVMASSITALIGVDIESICFELTPEVNAKLIPIVTGGYDADYNAGIERVLTLLVREMVKPVSRTMPRTYNILGSNIDTYNFLGNTREIRKLLKEAFSMNILACFTAYSSVGDIENAANAVLNIVVRADALPAAELMKSRFGISYVYGSPFGIGGTMEFVRRVSEATGIVPDMDVLKEKTGTLQQYLSGYQAMLRRVENKEVIVSGEYDTVCGLASLMSDIGLEPRALIVNHKKTKAIQMVLEENPWKKQLLFAPGEEEKESLLARPYYYVLGDDTLKPFLRDKKAFLQAANPNMDSYTFYDKTPFTGFGGILYMLQNLMNYERVRERN